MELQILGPLRVIGDEDEVGLGGLRRRAVLGYLLLHPNEVIPTSTLITALWGDQAPASARKILHNAVSQLRKTLAATCAETADISLLTRQPGYLLRVDERLLDFWRFRSLVQRARAAQADGCHDEAATLLREAIELWRGPALADLAEAGMRWSELEAAENARLDALEDYAEVELARGGHQAVVARLQSTAIAEPRRERLLGHFMVALFRCGRRMEALGVYDRASAELADRFGVAPCPDLQQLHQAILANDPAALAVGTPIVVAGRRAAADAAPPTQGDTEPEPAVAERRLVSLLAVRVDHGVGGGLDPERLDKLLTQADELIRKEIARFGGIVAGRLGSHWLIVFGARDSRADDAARAVLSALAVRDRLRQAAAEPAGRSVRMAIATGLVLVRRHPGTATPPAITGEVIDDCQALLPFVQPDEIWVSDETRTYTEADIRYERAPGTSVAWSVRAERRRAPAPGTRSGDRPERAPGPAGARARQAVAGPEARDRPGARRPWDGQGPRHRARASGPVPPTG